jgi:tetratricopeptide (TPR) repeat protein
MQANAQGPGPGNEATLRRSIAAATDVRARARLRVELAAVVRARDPAAAREELANAAKEAAPTQALTMAAIAMARTLPPPERVAWLGGLAHTGDGAAVPGILVALAAAQLDADQPRDAARTLLGLARDERLPPHHRRAAANKLVRICDRVDPILGRTALLAAALLAVGKTRRGLLRRAIALPATIERDPARVAADDETMARILLEWTKIGGEVQLAVEPVARLRAHKHVSAAMTEVVAALAPAPVRPQAPPAAAPAPAPAPVRLPPAQAFSAALAEAGAGHAHRARRLAEEAVRLSPPGKEIAARIGALDSALREGGFIKEALRLRRTVLESVDDEAERIAALRVLADEAAAAGLQKLAASWRLDAGDTPLPPVASEPEPQSPVEYYLAAQRLLARGDDDPVKVLALLEKALSRHPGADAALALAEKLVARVARGEESARRRLDLLRAAHADEYEPARRARLGWRLAAQLEAVGDVIGAVAVLERALEESAPGEGARVRGERARLLRSLGRPRELAGALEKDAGALLGDARLPVLAEQADLLEAAGEAERALDVRMMALAEFPGAPAVLDDARDRLEATGRPIESLALAIAALDHTTDRSRRLALLRDVAVLSEQPDVSANPGDAANAWLAVLGLAASDKEAAAAAERLLRAVGDWERCADLLAWQVARAAARSPDATDEGTDQIGLIWRLAELRRERMNEPDEALRLYGQLAGMGPALGPLADPPELAALVRRDFALAVETARAEVAPSAGERSRAFVGRAALLGARNRGGDAERDALAALDLDPRNTEAITALEKMYEGERRARQLAEELGRRASRLPPREAAPLHFGRGRAWERSGDRSAAREAYRRAMSLDPTLAEPVAALGALAAHEGDWSEVSKLLESEVGLATSPKRKGPLLIELALVHGDRLGDPGRAVTLLETAARFLPDDPRLLDLGARFQLAAGNWQAAADALDRLASRGATIADAAERFFAVGTAAEAAGQHDRALTLYSRSYGRDAGYRPTLERLSTICFERGQWDNAWKATEALLERHGAVLSAKDRATLLARSAIADLHIGQRAAATARLKTIVTRGASYVPDAGIRDVADSWAGMHIEPRLLINVEPRRRQRVLGRASEVLALVEDERDPVRGQALEIVGALAMAEGRWSDALATLEALSADEAFDAERRSDFLVAAGDILVQHYGDSMAARTFYDRARALWSGNPSLWHVAEDTVA